MNIRDQLRRDEPAASVHRRCCTCREVKPSTEFSPANKRCKKCRREKDRLYVCNHRDRVNANNRRKYHANKVAFRITQRRYEAKIRELSRTDKVWHAKLLMDGVRARAARFGLPMNISYRDVAVPDVCPVLGMKLKRNHKTMGPDSATVDRIDPKKGYVVGNVIVISMKANAIKNNGTPDEILKVGLFFKRLVSVGGKQ